MLAVRAALGVRVALKVAAVYVTVAPIGVVVPCLTRVTLVVVTDVGSSASLNVAVGATFSGWPVAPLAGVVLATVGGVVSGGGPPQVSLASAQSA